MRLDELEALLELIEALIDNKDRAAGIEELLRYHELKQDFINNFVEL